MIKQIGLRISYAMAVHGEEEEQRVLNVSQILPRYDV